MKPILRLLSLMAIMTAVLQAEPLHLFILSGQSNMRQPLPDAFRDVVEQAFGKENVLVVTNSQPSQSIMRWYKKWTPPAGAADKPGKAIPSKDIGTLYDALITQVKRALNGRTPASVTYIWMQGEADAENGWGEVYEQSFYGILEQIKADLGVSRVNYVLGRINDYWLTSKGIAHGDLVRSLQQKIGEAHPYGAWVDTDDLNTGLNPWGIYEFAGGHFPTPAYRVLGQRFARKACRLVDPAMKPDERLFNASFFDDAKQIGGHAAIGCEVGGALPTNGSITQLTDGKFGTSDPQDSRWITFNADDSGQTKLILDLKEIRELEQIGIHIRFDPKSGVLLPEMITFATSTDGTTYQPLGRDVRIFYKKSLRDAFNLQPETRTFLIIAPADGRRDAPLKARHVRIRILAPRTMIDEVIVNPTPRPQSPT